MRRFTAHRGFTLMEVLVASSLISVVMALALQAFTGMNRISNQANAKTVAGSEASKGVHAIVALLRRANIIYFSGRPITALDPAVDTNRTGDTLNADQNLRGVTNKEPVTDPIPTELGGSGVNKGSRLPYNFSDPTERLLTATGAFNPLVNVPSPPYRGKFRFYDDGTGAASANTLTGNDRLKSNDPAAVAASKYYDKFFSSPLLYIAEANFAKDDNGGGTNGAIEGMYLPLSWTFHVVYLAPMDVSGVYKNNEPVPGWVATNRAEDRGPGNWVRSTIPFELRVLTIPNVEADMDGDPLKAQRIDLAAHVLGAPYDYKANQINYDPVPIPFVGDLINWRTTGKVYPGSLPSVGQPSGARVRGNAVHANYNNIGNDPPSQTVFNRARLGGAVARDTVVARYVDPDAIHGTCVRLLNPNAAAAPPAGYGVYRQFLNAYDGEFLYNHYAPFQTGGWVVQNGGGIPRRALVSVTTRYRSDTRSTFQFGSENLEVDLENLVRYQSISRTSR